MHQSLHFWWLHHNKEIYSGFAGSVIGALVVFLMLPGLTAENNLYGKFTQSDTLKGVQAVSASEPVRLRIPSLEIDVPFGNALGLDVDAQIEVPGGYEEVGWYEYGPTPGELGPAVVLGHVDSYKGPAVFYTLRKAKLGDHIYIDRADGGTVVFEVSDTEGVLQSDFPTEQVFSDIDHAGLRLITCSGTFDEGQQKYSHNLIVFAKLVSDPDLGVQ